jgi:16S rRNA (cytidine1402-2'-O)-methyltransferase
MAGKVYVVPNLLGIIEPTAVLPARTIDIARRIEHWVVETPKAARAFIATLTPPRPIAQLSIRALADATDRASFDALLAPAREGGDIGLISDAGCPGVADPGADLVGAAHAAGIDVVPLVGPSAILLALMASGMNGQRFVFHGYLPVKPEARAQAIRALEGDSAASDATQLFIETPYRNVALIEALLATLTGSTRLCVAADLTLATETVISRDVQGWRGVDRAAFAKRPAVFALLAQGARRRG